MSHQSLQDFINPVWFEGWLLDELCLASLSNRNTMWPFQWSCFTDRRSSRDWPITTPAQSHSPNLSWQPSGSVSFIEPNFWNSQSDPLLVRANDWGITHSRSMLYNHTRWQLNRSPAAAVIGGSQLSDNWGRVWQVFPTGIHTKENFKCILA